ncbi:MAG TPA: phosphotransferase [Terriglobia bacterium]|nr:phosphotransferase [Terriglobia bacterium]
MTTAVERAKSLKFWSGAVTPQQIKGGITNANFRVDCGGQRYFVRIGDDIPVHGVMRFNELAASHAAARCGLSPQVRHAEPGALVFDFVDARTFAAEDVRQRDNLGRILDLIRRCHRDMPREIRGPALIFWVFHVLRDYAHSLKDAASRHLSALTRLMQIAEELEQMVGPVDIVYGHNDLLPSNLLDDGKRLWLIDWDYAGFNSPLFDLANLCSNNEVELESEIWLLEAYYERRADDDLLRRYGAMKCASLLRETLWSMISEIHSTLDFDYAAYTAENSARFERAYADLSHR